MKNIKPVKTIEQTLGSLIRFFLLIPPVFNLIGNYIGLTQQYTFYSFGFNGVSLLSRFIENNVIDITWRTIALVFVTFISSFLFFMLLRQSRKGKKGIFVFLFILYAADASLIFTNIYLENLTALSITTAIHGFVLLALLVLGFFYVLRSPIKRGYYDHA